MIVIPMPFSYRSNIFYYVLAATYLAILLYYSSEVLESFDSLEITIASF